MRRLLPWLGLLAAGLLGGLLLWLPARDRPVSPPVRAADRGQTPPTAPVVPATPVVPHTVGPGAARAEPARGPHVPERHGPFPANPAGVATALRVRAGEIGPCWQTWRAAHPDAPERPVLAFAITAEGATGRLSSGDGGDFDTCVADALSDATFEAPEVGLLTLMIPVPLPASE